MTDSAANEIVEFWTCLAVNRPTLRHAQQHPDQPGARDLAVVLTERFHAMNDDMVPLTLQQTLPLPTAGHCVRDILRACNEAYAVVAGRVVAAVRGDVFEVARAAVVEAKPPLRQKISLAVESAVRRG